MPSFGLAITRDYPWPIREGAHQYSAYVLTCVGSVVDHLDILCQNDLPQVASTCIQETNSEFHFYPSTSSKLRQILSLRPAGSARKYSTVAKSALSSLLERSPVIIVIDHMHSTWCVPHIKKWKATHPNCLIAYTTHNEEFSTRLSIAASNAKKPFSASAHFYDALRSYFAERWTTQLADLTTCISSRDQMLFQRYYGKKTKLLTPRYCGVTKQDSPINTQSNRRIGIVGSFVWAAKKRNLQLFLSTAYDQLQSNEVEISIIGKIENNYQQKLLERWPKVMFTGEVEEIQSHLSRCRIGVIPEHAGGGFKLKSLDYVFNRIPIYALRHAIVDLPLVHGVSAAMYENMDDLCNGIIHDINNVDQLNRYQRKAFDVCLSYLDANRGVQVFRDLLDTLNARS